MERERKERLVRCLVSLFVPTSNVCMDAVRTVFVHNGAHHFAVYVSERYGGVERESPGLLLGDGNVRWRGVDANADGIEFVF